MCENNKVSGICWSFQKWHHHQRPSTKMVPALHACIVGTFLKYRWPEFLVECMGGSSCGTTIEAVGGG